jgi:hypothetical protein
MLNRQNIIYILAPWRVNMKGILWQSWADCKKRSKRGWTLILLTSVRRIGPSKGLFIGTYWEKTNKITAWKCIHPSFKLDKSKTILTYVTL